MTYGTITSKKGFYVGDICYAMYHELYDEFWGDQCGYDDGIHTIPDDSIVPGTAGFKFAVASTAWGDGTYKDDDGRKYPVDAGVIGVLPLELVNFNNYTDGGHIFELPGSCMFEADDGKFTISLPNAEIIRIDTNY